MTCEACSGEWQRDVAELDGAGGTIVAQAGWYCWRCGAARFTATDLELAERQFPAIDAARAARAPDREGCETAKAA